RDFHVTGVQTCALPISPATPFVASFLGGGSVLRGTVREGRAAVGSLELSAPEGAPDGASVHALVRPHDVRVEKPVNTRGISLASSEERRGGTEGACRAE